MLRPMLTRRAEGAEGGQEGDGVKLEGRRDVNAFNVIREPLHLTSASERIRRKLEEGPCRQTSGAHGAGHMEGKAGFEPIMAYS